MTQTAPTPSIATALAGIARHCAPTAANSWHDRVIAARAGDANEREALCGALCWVAFAAPEATLPLYDGLAAAWLGRPSSPSEVSAVPAAPLDDGFWQAFRETLEGPAEGYDAGTITAAVAALGGAVAPAFYTLAERAATQTAASQRVAIDVPLAPLRLNDLATAAPGGLGRALFELWDGNGFDPEVLDRDAAGLAALPPHLRYFNTRILQMHDVWHLVAGYQTTSLHEMAISAFQLAQFGHNYSAMFLATVATLSHLRSPEGFPILFQNLSEAWHHGRQTPSLMAVDWESCWDQPINALRRELRIDPFPGSLPADLLEQAAALN